MNIFGLVQFHHWSLSDLEDLTCWEFDYYVDMVDEEVKKQKEEQLNGR